MGWPWLAILFNHAERTIRGNTPERSRSRRNSRKKVLVAEDQVAVASDHAEFDPNGAGNAGRIKDGVLSSNALSSA